MNGYATGEAYVHQGYANGQQYANGQTGTGISFVNGTGYDSGNATANT